MKRTLAPELHIILKSAMVRIAPPLNHRTSHYCCCGRLLRQSWLWQHAEPVIRNKIILRRSLLKYSLNNSPNTSYCTKTVFVSKQTNKAKVEPSAKSVGHYHTSVARRNYPLRMTTSDGNKYRNIPRQTVQPTNSIRIQYVLCGKPVGSGVWSDPNRLYVTASVL